MPSARRLNLVNPAQPYSFFNVSLTLVTTLPTLWQNELNRRGKPQHSSNKVSPDNCQHQTIPLTNLLVLLHNLIMVSEKARHT